MTSTGRPDKRAAIERAARKAFGRDGYTRTSVDAIATEAQVSKRAIYNHFTDKEQLFLAVALDGAAEVTEATARLMELTCARSWTCRRTSSPSAATASPPWRSSPTTSRWCGPSKPR
ncbi:TetR/AcrR family transcriptional regulator [Saccharopolyspora thermophila]|uniref:TetR/AcrR family transcriptional regulator n=1 Tax=Saccharopolyspora thermophila TaxID=89367 RepID=UPI001E5BA2D2|nr:TetR/AcrR family transcriptional regulator [Saccharopolyspora subtropica]